MTEDDKDKTVIADVASFDLAAPRAENGHAYLVQYNGDAIGKRYVLEGSQINVGRSATSDLAIPENSVSRLHATIHRTDDAISIEDAGSANGVYVNEQKIASRTTLKDGDMIGLGNVLLKFFSHDNLDGVIQDKIYKMATIDAGTQIFNKQYLLDALKSELTLSKSSGNPLSIIYFDLDHFKKVNDTYGHNAGDQVLKESADVIKNTIRKDDIFARFGGEEFVIICPKTEQGSAYTLAEKIRIAIESHVYHLQYEKNGTKENVDHKQTISLGVAEADQKISSSKQLLETADNKLYTSKTSGRNRTTI